MDAKTYARMRAIAEELMEREDTWAVEVGEGVITMIMSPVNRHELIALRLRRQIERQMADDPEWAGHVAHSGPEIEAPAIGRMRRPDLVVVAEQALDTPGSSTPPTSPWWPRSSPRPTRRTTTARRPGTTPPRASRSA